MINEKLAEYNTRIIQPIIWDAKLDTIGVLVETEKVDKRKRGKPKSMFASYCPFCGEKIE